MFSSKYGAPPSVYFIIFFLNIQVELISILYEVNFTHKKIDDIRILLLKLKEPASSHETHKNYT